MSNRKRRKVDNGAFADACFEEIISELDLEIALSRRVAEACQSRITWALMLQDSLRKGSTGSSTSFKDAACDALDAIEQPLDVIFERELTSNSLSKGIQPSLLPRPPPKPKPLRNPNARFLFIRSSDLEPPYDKNHVQTYLLRCPTCLRQAFTSLQGLFNHARISHRIEWGTHDECVRACAVAAPDLELEWGNEVGLGPNGILPGLRSLFNMAVGAHQANQAGETQIEENHASTATVGHSEAPPDITRSLGFHEDTPALAYFLGKQAIRRGIKIWGNPDDTVDIQGFDDNSWRPSAPGQILNHCRPWKMHFSHRNDYERETEHEMQAMKNINDLPTPHVERTSAPGAPEVATVNEASDTTLLPQKRHWGTTGTRFHFVARISVMDHSFWIPPESRVILSPEYTHRWMISVDAPSYSHHITTVLKRLTVSSKSISCTLSTTKPPFAIVGLTNEPFLANIEMQFSGAPGPDGEVADQTVYLEHWVELDLLKSAHPVVGEEQMVDIELDKGTILLPLQKDYLPISARALWSQGSGIVHDTAEKPQSTKRKLRNTPQVQTDYTTVLKRLVKKFPMTMKETKLARQVHPIVPYQLLPRSQFDSLVTGRKKAIEWSRARALQNAYTQEIQRVEFHSQDLIPLTTADIYYWLSEEGYFIRPPVTLKHKSEGTDTLKKEQLPYDAPLIYTAGADVPNLADSVKMEYDDCAGAKATATAPCNVPSQVVTMPLANVLSRLSTTIDAKQSNGEVPRVRAFRDSELVAASNPKLTSAVHNLVSTLKLPTFASSSGSESIYPVDRLGANKARVESHLAPYAALAIAVRRFAHVLVEGGVAVTKSQEEAPPEEVIKKEIQLNSTTHIVLMPSHILESVVTRRRDASSRPTNSLDITMFECLSRLGVPATFTGLSSSDQGSPMQETDPVVRVKVEEIPSPN